MSEQEVIDQLSRYGTWLEENTGLRLKGDDWSQFEALVAFDGSDTVPTDDDLLHPVEPIEILASTRLGDTDLTGGSVEEIRSFGARIPRTVRLLVGASVLGLVAVVGGLWLNGQSSSLTTADLPPDPPGALFVLPDPALELELSGEWAAGPPDKPDSGLPSRAYVFAITDGTVFHRPVNAWVSREEPNLTDWEEAVEDPAPGGPAFVSESGPGQRVYQQRGEFFLFLTSSTLTTDELLEMLGELEMDGDGRLTLSKSSDLTLMDSFDLGPALGWFASMFEANGGSEVTVTIETGDAPSGTVSAGFVGGQWLRWEQDGRYGWEVRGAFEHGQAPPAHDGEEGPSNAVVWQATPNWVVFASGQVSIEELHQIVAGLRVVSEEEWRAAFER